MYPGDVICARFELEQLAGVGGTGQVFRARDRVSDQTVAVKVLDPHLGPIAITFLPFYVTTLFFVPLLLQMRRANPKAANPSAIDWIKFIIAGVGGQVLAQLGMTWGISKSLASNGAILNLLIPVISAVLASFMLK